jgi:uncharacterized protein (DUF433 family)
MSDNDAIGRWRRHAGNQSDMTKSLDRISIDPAICGGKPCIKGTRIWVSLIRNLLDCGTSERAILQEYPTLTHEDVLAVLAFDPKAE